MSGSSKTQTGSNQVSSRKDDADCCCDDNFGFRIPISDSAGNIVQLLSDGLYVSSTVVQNLTNIHDGPFNPNNRAFRDGDYFINTTTGVIYKKVSGAWVYLATFMGADGTDGTDGTNGTPGTDGDDYNTLLTKIIDDAEYTFVNADFAGNVQMYFTAADVVLTIPAGLTNMEPVAITQMGTGQGSVQGDGASVVSSFGLYFAAQYSVCGLMKMDTDTYVFLGDTSE